ncbi:MAG TPA: acyltransferase [Chloroflexaceae bacterium]|nr:acyltransferase [Chloroflexaceae bacterium]
MRDKLLARWAIFWLRLGGLGPLGRAAAWLAGLFTPPYKGRAALARKTPRGYIAPSARVHCRDLRLGRHVFLGDRVTIYQGRGGGPVELGDRAHLHQDTVVEVGQGGSVSVGADTHIQNRCQLSAYLRSIRIGANVQVAPACAFFPYDHGTAPGAPMREQPLTSRGDIVVEDDVWLGYGVVVLAGARIGRGAVVGANSVVTGDIPPGAVAVGAPARVVRARGEAAAAGGRDNGRER